MRPCTRPEACELRQQAWDCERFRLDGSGDVLPFEPPDWFPWPPIADPTPPELLT